MGSFMTNSLTISGLLGLIEAEQIVIPEIQRPFVWDKTKVRNLIDSLYNGFPIGYLILWQNPKIKTKDGLLAGGKKIIIDGQQRITSLMAAISGRQIVDENYNRIFIKIAFNPMDGNGRFEVQTPAIVNDKKWIADISELFKSSFDHFNFIEEYCKANPEISKNDLNKTILRLKSIENVMIGTIDLDASLEIDIVTEIFIRINSQGKTLSQADFAMSKIASDEQYGGNMLRKAIDYFCHLSVAPNFYEYIINNDKEFAKSEFAPKIKWLQNENDDVFDPDYNDMLRVAFMHVFERGKIADLVNLLSGRDFKEDIAEASFKKLKEGILNFINEHNFKSFLVAIKSAGFITPNMINSSMALDFAYTLFLILQKTKEVSTGEIKKLVQKWYVLSVLTGRYTGSPETAMDKDIRSIKEKGFVQFFKETEAAVLSDTFWNVGLVQNLETISTTSPSYLVYLAAQVFFNDVSLLSSSSTVKILIEETGNIHHIFPKEYLRQNGIKNKIDYNQVANYAHLDTQVNISLRNLESVICQHIN